MLSCSPLLGRGGWELLGGDDTFEGLRETVSRRAYAMTVVGIVGVLIGLLCILFNDLALEFPLIPWVGLMLYLAYLLEARSSNTSQYLGNVYSEKELHEYVEAVQAAAPSICFITQNFHFEHHDPYVWNGPGSGMAHTQGSIDHTRSPASGPCVVRVNTHYAAQEYGIRGVTDATRPPSEALKDFMDKASRRDSMSHSTNAKGTVSLLLCEFPLDFRPRDSFTEQDFAQTRQRFFLEQAKDVHQETHENRTINFDEYRRYLLVVLALESDDLHSRPWWMRRCIFWLAALLLLSLPFRVMLFHNTHKVVWQVVKHFSALEPSQWIDHPIHAIAQSQVANDMLAESNVQHEACGPQPTIPVIGAAQEGYAA